MVHIIKWARVHGARTVRTLLCNYTPQTDPHKKALDSNIGTKKNSQEMGISLVSCSLN